MNSNLSPNILFALLIGVAIVSGVIVYNNLTDRIAQAPGIHQAPTLPQELPDLNASSMRTRIETDTDLTWLQTVPEQNAPSINVRTSVGGTFEPSDTITRQFGLSVFRETIRSGADNASSNEFDDRIRTLSQEFAQKTLAETFSGADIQTVPAVDDEVIRTYFNNLATIFINNSPQNTTARADLFRTVMDDPATASTLELEEISQSYQQMRDGFLAEPVPHAFITQHVALINAAEVLRNDFAAVANIVADPLAAQLSIQRYIYHSEILTRSLQMLGLEVIRYQHAFDFATDPALLFILTLPDSTQN